MVTRGKYDSDMPWYELFRQSSVCVVLISFGWENGCNNISESMRERKHVITSCPTLIYRHKLKLPRLLFTVLSLPPCFSPSCTFFASCWSSFDCGKNRWRTLKLIWLQFVSMKLSASVSPGVMVCQVSGPGPMTWLWSLLKTPCISSVAVRRSKSGDVWLCPRCRVSLYIWESKELPSYWNNNKHAAWD